jgi:hypothetical protein
LFYKTGGEMELTKLKTDKHLPHHYFIGVAMKPITTGKEAGKMYLKYGPLYFHNKNIRDLRNALILSKDKLFPTTQIQALRIYGITHWVHALSGMLISSEVNQVTIHHFSSKCRLNSDHFESLVKLANKSKYAKDLLNESRIDNHRSVQGQI